MAGSGHVLEPRDDVNQIEDSPCTVAVPRAYGIFKRLERKGATVKRLTGLWGASIRLSAESLVRVQLSTRFRWNALYVAGR